MHPCMYVLIVFINVFCVVYSNVFMHGYALYIFVCANKNFFTRVRY